MVQSFRQVKLSTLANVFPQPICYESRLRNLQRFLVLPFRECEIAMVSYS
jgi:hypothetical protein